MSEKLKPVAPANMTKAQRVCFEVLRTAFHGDGAWADRVYAAGDDGIKCTAGHHRLSTFDFDYLTRLVVLAHDACVRLEIVSSRPGTVGLMLHKRSCRSGNMFDRHPTIEEAIGSMRPRLVALSATEDGKQTPSASLT